MNQRPAHGVSYMNSNELNLSPPTPPEVRLPDGTVDLVRDLVPAVRRLLGRGLSDEFQRSCVRVGAFKCFGGGLKSSLVGGLRIDVSAVLKLGGPDLALHHRLMSAVNAHRPRTFPTVLDRVEIDAHRQFLLMEDLRKYSTLLDLIYRDGLPDEALGPILDKTVAALVAIRETGDLHRHELDGVPVQPVPFFDRLRDKLHAVLAADPVLTPILTKPGCVMGLPCPPLDEILTKARAFLQRTASTFTPVLQHGDPHLGNIMVRRYGRSWSVRLIDPNPGVGFTDPLYDVGKLFHWAEPVGWAHVAPEVCHTEWRCRRTDWELAARHEPPDAAAEQRRTKLVTLLNARLCRLVPDDSDASLRLRLPLAIAAAHVGLAALLKSDAQRHARRFVLAHTLRLLAEWRGAM